MSGGGAVPRAARVRFKPRAAAVFGLGYTVMENFFGIMKQEMYYGKVYYSFEELKQAIEKYIKYYNEKTH